MVTDDLWVFVLPVDAIHSSAKLPPMQLNLLFRSDGSPTSFRLTNCRQVLAKLLKKRTYKLAMRYASLLAMIFCLRYSQILTIKQGEFGWSQKATEQTLHDINLSVRKGELIGILGRMLCYQLEIDPLIIIYIQVLVLERYLPCQQSTYTV